MMKRFPNCSITSAFAAALAISALCAANVYGQAGGKRGSEEELLRQLEDDWLGCYVSGDRSKYDRIVADEFIGTDEGAVVRTKADDRALLPATPTLGGSAVNEDVKVRTHGSFAVVTGQIVTRMQVGDKEIAGFKTRFTDTWIKRKGEWKVIARHYSRAAIERTAMSIEPSVFEEYKGTYELGRGMEVIVSREGSKLFGEFPGPSKLELFPESDQVFFTKAIPALFIFLRDKTGRVFRMLTIQDGRVMSAAKIH
jgi:hypothetical protein